MLRPEAMVLALSEPLVNQIPRSTGMEKKDF